MPPGGGPLAHLLWVVVGVAGKHGVGHFLQPFPLNLSCRIHGVREDIYGPCCLRIYLIPGLEPLVLSALQPPPSSRGLLPTA